MVTVRITETYDMKTTKGKLGIIGIHTPTGDQVRNLYSGLCKNYKYIRFKRCDVVGACSSVLPADPLQVGVESGLVAPEDMFNPLLYKAVSNSSFDALVNRIYDTVNSSEVIDSGSVNSQDADLTEEQAFSLYYGLLAEHGRFRKSMPQTGFRISKLVPFCHTLVSQYGNLAKPHTTVANDAASNLYATPDNLGNVPIGTQSMDAMVTNAVVATSNVFRGKAVKMPRLPLHYDYELGLNSVAPTIPKTFVACLVIPPARLHEFYYRMRVTWTISFEGLVSTMAVNRMSSSTLVGAGMYGSNYTIEDAKTALTSQNSSIDADNVDVTKIMES